MNREILENVISQAIELFLFLCLESPIIFIGRRVTANKEEGPRGVQRSVIISFREDFLSEANVLSNYQKKRPDWAELLIFRKNKLDSIYIILFKRNYLKINKFRNI